MKLWQIAALLVSGIAVGVAFPGRFTHLFGQATLYVFLPALIFEGAWRLELSAMRGSWRPIGVLVVPGVLVTAAIIAGFAHLVGGLSWRAALVLGAILSATDPVAVVAVFQRLPVPDTLATIVQSESLLNDAAAVVLYRAVLGGSVVQALVGVVLGIAAGAVVALALGALLRRHGAIATQTIASFVGAYGVYFLADRYNWSGIFAVLVFAIVLREMERRSITVSCVDGVSNAWNVIALVANIALFFLIGTALDITSLANSLPIAAVTLAAVLLARIAVAYGLLAAVRSQLAKAWRTVIRMAGIRGALSLALALATPFSLAKRGLIVDATFIVVVCTLLVATLTLRRRMGRLPLGE